MQIETLKWVGDVDGYLELIDQRKLPNEFQKLPCKTPEQLFEAIQTLAVRGAPAIGVSAAYGVCIVAQSIADSDTMAHALKVIGKGCDYLATSRPTAVNLFWALDRMRQAAEKGGYDSVATLKVTLLDEAHAICKEDQQMCRAIGEHGAFLIPEGGAVLTHCNAGALATAGIGTALAPMYVAHGLGKRFKVYVDETRPLLQGARLTAWELTQAGIDATLICDNMSATLMADGKIDAIITGADRIAANGDAANKIGTLALSILAKHYNVPFYIAAPSSTFDLSIESGDQIPIEQRNPDEICRVGQTAIAPDAMKVYNPAFDVSNAENITAIITEKGIIARPDTEKISRLLSC
jgi:methylthioribose-1-phosphate isomerase